MSKPNYPFNAGDIVELKATGRKGVARSVGQFGNGTTVLVTYFDDETSEHIPLSSLKKTLRGIDGGRPD